MEPENTPISSTKPPPLNSDQLNYLIWRYLQESGYAEAAVKLQRDWKIDAEGLPFAKHVKGQALISLVQKGLRYHHLSLTIDENGRPSKQLTPSMFFFGPESERSEPEAREILHRPTSSHQVSTPENSNLVIPRKREPGPSVPPEAQPQPAPKRSRKTNAERNGGRKTSMPPSSNIGIVMDVDAVNGHALSVQEGRSPSAVEATIEEQGLAVNGIRTEDRMEVDTDGEQTADQIVETIPPIIPTLASGDSVGIQVVPAKIANLGPSTTILGVPDDKQTIQTTWRPQDPRMFATRGESVCGIWQHQFSNGEKKMDFQELVSFKETDQSFVTAVAWEPNGSVLAVATCSNNGGELHLYDGQELALLETLPASQRAIIRLQWQKTGLRLVGLAPYDEQNVASTVLLWDLSGTATGPGPLSVTVPETLEDLDCALSDGAGVACAAGGQAVYHFRAYSELEVEQKWIPRPQDGLDGCLWAFVKCSWRSQDDALLVAASSESGRLWLPAKELAKRDAHHAAITGLQIRPNPASGPNALSTSEFATSSEDGLIKVWKYESLSNSLKCLSKLTLGPTELLKTLAFSPDGFCLAGASYSTVRIWNAEHAYNQMANWQGNEEEWKGSSFKDEDLVSNGAMSSLNGEGTTIVSDSSLGWDCESKQLAFALGSQVAVINFQR